MLYRSGQQPEENWNGQKNIGSAQLILSIVPNDDEGKRGSDRRIKILEKKTKADWPAK